LRVSIDIGLTRVVGDTATTDDDDDDDDEEEA
jgi:hypothetical protein